MTLSRREAERALRLAQCGRRDAEIAKLIHDEREAGSRIPTEAEVRVARLAAEARAA